MRSITVTAEVDVQDVLDDLNDAAIREECARRGIELAGVPKKVERSLADQIEEERYAFDSLMHGLMATYLDRDHRHFVVLMARLGGRYRDAVARALAAEKVTA